MSIKWWFLRLTGLTLNLYQSKQNITFIYAFNGLKKEHFLCNCAREGRGEEWNIPNLISPGFGTIIIVYSYSLKAESSDGSLR